MKRCNHWRSFAGMTTAVILGGPAGACHAGLITATHAPPKNPTSGFNGGAGMGTDGMVFDNRRGQIFTTLAAGRLSTVSFTASKLAGTDVDLRLNVTTVENDQPGTVLATTLIDQDSFFEGFLSLPSEFTHTVDLTDANVSLEENEMYALVFLTDTIEANYRMYGDYEGYDGGDMIFSQNGAPFDTRPGQDLFFEVQVGIPAPASACLLLAGMVGVRRRRQ